MALNDLWLPASVKESMGAQQNFDEIRKRWVDLQAMEASLSTHLAATQAVTVTAAAQVDIAVASTDNLAIIDFDLETSALCELHMFPNALGTAIYYYVSDGSDQTTVASAAVAANGIGAADANGARLALVPKIAIAGGQQMTGRATFGLRIPTSAPRTCIATTAVASIPASANEIVELQTIASRIVTAAGITSLRFAVSAGTMTGRIQVTRS